jgi:hypothetical protein
MIYVDLNEPLNIQGWIGTSYPTERLALNQMGFADYLYHTHDGKVHQFERKQSKEIMSTFDKVELQLKRQIELGVADTLELLVEGHLAYDEHGTATYSLSKDGKVLYRTGVFRRPYNLVLSKFLSYKAQGIDVTMLASSKELAGYIVSSFKKDGAPPPEGGPATFNTYIKPRPQVLEYNPHVLTLMGVEGGGAGEEIAKAWVKELGSPIEVFTSFFPGSRLSPPSIYVPANVKMASGRRVGEAKAGQFLRAIDGTNPKL